jgi:predicted alpha/beta hydrolase family esterase
MKSKPQIFIIHGGMTFKNQKDYIDFLKNVPIKLEKKVKWTEAYLDNKLGKEYEIIRPRMPLQDNAKYEEWKISFERFFPFFKNDIILIGSSLGGIFLSKYLSENKFPKKIKAAFMICPPYDNTVQGEDLVGGFKLGKDLSLIEKNSKHTYLIFSKDDDVVPVSHAEKYRAKLKKSEIIIYESKSGHFKISEFPEIVKIIKSI